MTSAERVIQICTEKKIRLSRLEKECGFANGYIKGLKSGVIPPDRVKKLAEVLDVPYHAIDPDTFPEPKEGYYLNPETAAMAQTLFEQPGMRILFDAARDSRPEDLAMAADLLKRLKETNPDG